MDNKMNHIANTAMISGGTGAAAAGVAVKVQTVMGFSVEWWTVMFGLFAALIALAGFGLQIINHLDQRRHRRKIERIQEEEHLASMNNV